MLEKWHYIYTVITIMVIYVNYMLLRLKLSDYDNIYSPIIKSNYAHNYSLLQQCCNPLFCSVEGEWNIRPNLRNEDLTVMEHTNMELRIKKGWPTNLYHGDMRCGKKYPLPRLLRTNNTKLYALDIPSQCEHFSDTPCCRDDIGWCGQGDTFCNCPTCVNYSSLIYAELSSWTPRNNCKIKKLFSNDTCWFLDKHFSSVTFIGDSLVRHTFSALLIHLTQDRVYGALRANQSKQTLEFCKDESQFVDSSCHTKLATKWLDIKTNKKYCASTNRKVKLAFIQAYNTGHTQLAMSAMEEALQEHHPLFLIGIGIHEQFNVTKVINYYLRPILQLRNMYKNVEAEIIWFNTHAAGTLKPLMFQETQGNKNILSFNRQMREFCRTNNIIVFDMFNITVDVHSFDGTHYGSELNLLKVELLIEGLKSLSRFR